MLEDIPPALRLALAYATARARPATLALFALDARLGSMLRGAREPLAVQLRLAWWRDTLRQPKDSWPAGEPILQSLRDWRDPERLATLPEAWEALLAEELTPEVIAEYVAGRGLAYASLAGELGVAAVDDAAAAGRVWALADLAANMSEGPERRLVVEYGARQPASPRLSATLRPLAVLAGLSQRALARGGAQLLDGPGAALLAMRIGIAGR